MWIAVMVFLLFVNALCFGISPSAFTGAMFAVTAFNTALVAYMSRTE